MSTRTPAQRRAIAIAIAKKKKASTISGRGGYRRRAPYTTSRRKPAIRGRGEYAKDYGQRLGSVVGEGLQELLSQLGGLVGIGKAVGGMGDYAPIGFTVKSNKLAEGNDPPEVINGKEGSFIIRHREYIKDIYSSGDGSFHLEAFNINPGNQTLFPWLSEIAANFEQYRVEGMVMEFRSNYGEATTGSLGTVIMATEYEVNKENFSSKVQMENHQYAASCKPSLSMLHPIECARSQTPLTELCVRVSADGSHSAADDEDARFCDLGKFQIASVGLPFPDDEPVNLGELWCSYQVRFLKPRLDLSAQSHAYFAFSDSGVSTSNPFGTDNDRITAQGNNLDMDLHPEGLLTFPADAHGTYMVYVTWAYSSEAATLPAYTGAVGLSEVSGQDPWAAVALANGPASPQATATATRKSNCFFFTMTEGYTSNPSVQIQSGAQTTFTNFAIVVVQMPDLMGTLVSPAPLPFTSIFERTGRSKQLTAEEKHFIRAATGEEPEEKEEKWETPDLSQSTTNSINEIIAKAQQKKLLLDKQVKPSK